MSEDGIQVYGALTIDNDILKGRGYKFDEGLLKQLVQFADSPIKIIFSDIIHNEAKNHLASNISNARNSINKAIKSASKHLQMSEDRIKSAKKALTLEDDDNGIAETRLNIYYEKINAEIINSNDYLEIEALMEKYFSTQAPFETKKDKKNEFPDAIALLCLDSWAEENDTKVLVVSKDKGWKEFAGKSEWLTVKEDLSEAIEAIQPESQVKAIIENLTQNGFFKENSPIYDSIKDAIINSLEVDHIDIEACSSFYYEYEDIEVTYISHDFYKDQDGQTKVNVVGIEPDRIILTVDTYIKCEVSASFDFSAWDSIDKEYIGLATGSNVSTEEEYHTEVLIELYGNFTQGYVGMDIGEIAVSETIGFADFGEIEPDWHDYED